MVTSDTAANPVWKANERFASMISLGLREGKIMNDGIFRRYRKSSHRSFRLGGTSAVWMFVIGLLLGRAHAFVVSGGAPNDDKNQPMRKHATMERLDSDHSFFNSGASQEGFLIGTYQPSSDEIRKYRSSRRKFQSLAETTGCSFSIAAPPRPAGTVRYPSEFGTVRDGTVSFPPVMPLSRRTITAEKTSTVTTRSFANRSVFSADDIIATQEDAMPFVDYDGEVNTYEHTDILTTQNTRKDCNTTLDVDIETKVSATAEAKQENTDIDCKDPKDDADSTLSLPYQIRNDTEDSYKAETATEVIMQAKNDGIVRKPFDSCIPGKVSEDTAVADHASDASHSNADTSETPTIIRVTQPVLYNSEKQRAKFAPLNTTGVTYTTYRNSHLESSKALNLSPLSLPKAKEPVVDATRRASGAVLVERAAPKLINSTDDLGSATSFDRPQNDRPLRTSIAKKKKRTLYDVLGARSNETRSELKRRYLTLAKMSHPDALSRRQRQSQVGAAPKPGQLLMKQGAKMEDLSEDLDFTEIAAAWSVLSDPKQRKRYDRSLLAEEVSENIQGLVGDIAKTAGPMAVALGRAAVPFFQRMTASRNKSGWQDSVLR